MSRIGDSSDDDRIREMQEMEYRQRTDREKRTDQERVTKSFQEVMSTRARNEQARKFGETSAKQKAADTKPKGTERDAQKRQQGKAATTSREMARRQAMSSAMSGQLQKTRADLSERARGTEAERYGELVQKSDDDKDSLQKDVRKDDLREAERADQQSMKDPLARVELEDDGRSGRQNSGGQGGGQGDDRQPRGEAIAATAQGQGAQGAQKIPQELIEHIAKSIAIATATDGRTELAISLKGTLLDGVTLHVAAKKGKVTCVFEGCDKHLGNLIESSKGELMRQLGKRGLELDILRVK
ncbi:MAG: hypothetical protein U1E65_26905 [Myxococcota bacterium]